MGGWKTFAGLMLASAGNLLKTKPGLEALGDLLIAAGLALGAVGVEHKARKFEAQIRDLTENLKKPSS